MSDLEITLHPTGEFITVNGAECRKWVGKTVNGHPIFAMVAVVGVHEDAAPEVHEAFAKALREVKAERNWVSYDMRLFVD